MKNCLGVFAILVILMLAAAAQAESVLEPDDQLPACYVGGNADQALSDLLNSDLYHPKFSDALSYITEGYVYGIQVAPDGRQTVTTIAPCVQ